MEIDVKDYIDANISLNDRLFPVFTEDLSDVSIVYTFSPVTGGLAKQSQLTLKVIWDDYDRCKEIEKELNEILDQSESDQFIIYNNTKFKSALSGGGVLFNDGPQMYELTLIYIIKWREK
ncbi:hypothetical protein GH811_17580 [Acetobacterium malicum]|uniref:Uncharacterized protein n=1 Tax=Acetobacterium malicum TaxID=52692 RepID=A0ABR6Z1Y5_9FIRM|nr:hypothetical protein [Acetobacterium malicum]MBC3901414.1 hypothetical protein [Acetobacterium malicum]